MKLKNIYELAIEMGREADPFGFADFPDCRVINLPERDLATVFAGIDVGVAELLLIERLKEKGIAIDAIISHHPVSSAAYLMADVARIQQRSWESLGVDKKTAKSLADKLIREAKIEAGAENHLRVRDAARMLNLPLACIHTPIDNLVQDFFSRLLEGKSNLSLGKVLEIIKKIPECRLSSEDGVEPYLAGRGGKPLGSYMVDMTGGLDPPSEIFSYLKKVKVDTIVGMHYSMDNIKAIEGCGLSAIICGHIASDSIGLNLFCDRLEELGLSVVGGSGLYRVKR
ncbi:MAG: hypothetical protein ACQEP5_05405 [Actinomycetota bacterium]